MYRRCVLCGWGRKECRENIKFYCIPKEAGLQRMKWMSVLQDKRSNGFKKVDSVCSLHFKQGKPSSDPTHVDFVPTLYLIRTEIPDNLRKPNLLQCCRETEETAREATKRKEKLDKLKHRMDIMKQNIGEPKDAWMKRKQERIECARKNGEQIPEKFWEEVDYATIKPPPMVDETAISQQEPAVKKPRRPVTRPRSPVYEEFLEEIIVDEDPDYHIMEEEPYQGVEVTIDVVTDEPDLLEDPVVDPIAHITNMAPARRPRVQRNYLRAPGPSHSYGSHIRRGPTVNHIHDENF